MWIIGEAETAIQVSPNFEITLTSMKRVTLLFQDAKSLWAFAETLQKKDIEINSAEKKLYCNCSDAEISKALMHYNAVIIDEVEKRNPNDSFKTT